MTAAQQKAAEQQNEDDITTAVNQLLTTADENDKGTIDSLRKLGRGQGLSDVHLLVKGAAGSLIKVSDNQNTFMVHITLLHKLYEIHVAKGHRQVATRWIHEHALPKLVDLITTNMPPEDKNQVASTCLDLFNDYASRCYHYVGNLQLASDDGSVDSAVKYWMNAVKLLSYRRASSLGNILKELSPVNLRANIERHYTMAQLREELDRVWAGTLSVSAFKDRVGKLEAARMAQEAAAAASSAAASSSSGARASSRSPTAEEKKDEDARAAEVEAVAVESRLSRLQMAPRSRAAIVEDSEASEVENFTSDSDGESGRGTSRSRPPHRTLPRASLYPSGTIRPSEATQQPRRTTVLNEIQLSTLPRKPAYSGAFGEPVVSGATTDPPPNDAATFNVPEDQRLWDQVKRMKTSSAVEWQDLSQLILMRSAFREAFELSGTTRVMIYGHHKLAHPSDSILMESGIRQLLCIHPFAISSLVITPHPSWHAGTYARFPLDVLLDLRSYRIVHFSQGHTAVNVSLADVGDKITAGDSAKDLDRILQDEGIHNDETCSILAPSAPVTHLGSTEMQQLILKLTQSETHQGGITVDVLPKEEAVSSRALLREALMRVEVAAEGLKRVSAVAHKTNSQEDWTAHQSALSAGPRVSPLSSLEFLRTLRALCLSAFDSLTVFLCSALLLCCSDCEGDLCRSGSFVGAGLRNTIIGAPAGPHRP